MTDGLAWLLNPLYDKHHLIANRRGKMSTVNIADRKAVEAEAGSGELTSKAGEKRKRPVRRTWIVGATALAITLAGVAYIVAPSATQTTDNAYVSADTTSVAPKVRGLITQVLVRDNQIVHVGDPLVQIEPEEFNARVATATAELADAKAGVASAHAALASLDAEERLAASNVRVSESSIRAANAQAERAKADRRRYENLVASGAVPVRDADTYRTTAITAEQDVARVSALFDVAQDSEAVTRSKRAALTAALQKAEANVARTSAALDLAMQDQRHTVIVAPIDGIVGNRQVEQGDYVQPGTRLLTLVPLQDRYITANFKETQTGRMKSGQHAHIVVDALPGRKFLGTVDSLAPGSGSTFSLLPFEPGAGNFTKIVQRVPVRIRLNPEQTGLACIIREH